MLAPLGELIAEARGQGYALGGFNTYNLEITAAIVGAAEEVRAPVIVQTGSGALRGAAASGLPALVLDLARAATVPVAVHLDHSDDLALMERCVGWGYTSLMVDGSAEPLAGNIALTRRAVALGRAAGLSVEAELVGFPGDEDDASLPGTRPATFTDPDTAAEFVEATGVDLLAVAIGNVHGFYRGEPRLDLALLDELRRRVAVPLVLHGASGLPDEALRACIARGIVKINVNTELRAAYCDALQDGLPAARAGYDVATLMRRATAAVQAVVTGKLRLLGAAGRC